MNSRLLRHKKNERIRVMKQKGVLPTRVNMSLGFVPAILSMLTYGITTQRIALCIGAAAGILFSVFAAGKKGRRMPQIILYSTTGVLLLLAAINLATGYEFPHRTFPFALETGILLPALFILLIRKHISADAAIVSSRVTLLISLPHFLAILCALFIQYPPDHTVRLWLFCIVPPLIFLASILFNQYGIYYFNRLMRHTLFVPIVNAQGDIIGRVPATEIFNRNNRHLHPVIRIAVVSHGMLFLAPRSPQSLFEKGKTDLLMETYLTCGETLEQAVQKLLKQTFPILPLSTLHFSYMYPFQGEEDNRLVYLFTLDLDDDSILSSKAFRIGKLWTLRQMKHNLGQGFFSSYLEHELGQLPSAIYTKGKYRES